MLQGDDRRRTIDAAQQLDRVVHHRRGHNDAVFRERTGEGRKRAMAAGVSLNHFKLVEAGDCHKSISCGSRISLELKSESGNAGAQNSMLKRRAIY
jgi:hypothetical protein